MSSPTLSRRTLLQLGTAATGALAASHALGGCSRPAVPPDVPAGGAAPARAGTGQLAGEPDWEAIRGEFELSRDFIHMACLLVSTHPRVVSEAIERHRRALDQNPADYLHKRWSWTAAGLPEDGEERVVRAAGRYLDTDPDLIALTDSTTMSLAMLYNGITLRPDQEILTTEHEHGSSRYSLQLRAQRSGCRMRTIRLYDDAAQVTAEGLVQGLVREIRPETRVLAVTWVHSRSGVKLPIGRLAAEVAGHNRDRAPENRILLCVDGVHGFGVEDVTMAGLGCDFFAAGCHKWLFGPRGTGILWGAAHAWEHVTPTIPSFSSVAKQSPGRRMTPGGFHSFEHRWALDTAFDFHLGIGKAHVQQRTHALAAQLKRGLADSPGVRLITPLSQALSSGIVVFEVPGKQAEDVAHRLHELGIIASTTPGQTPQPRLTPGLLNTPEEIERTVDAVRKVAAA